MLYIVPLVILLVGLGIGAGLWFVSRWARRYLECVEKATPCQGGNLTTGLVKMQGVARAVNPQDLLTSPIGQKPCVYYKFVIEQYRASTTTNRRTPTGTPRSMNSGTWEKILEDEQAIPMVIADETGEAGIDPREARLDLKGEMKQANLFSKLPPQLEQSLRDRYKVVTKGMFLPKQMRYSEVVLAQDDEIFVAGDCEVSNGQAAFAKKDNPLLLSFRKEADVVHMGKIMTKLAMVGAVAVPALFLLFAGFVFYKISSTFGGARNQPAVARQNPGKDNKVGKDGAAVQQAIVKLKSSNLSLNDRARAARQLAEAPPEKGLVEEVAPLLNPLLESKDGFHRDSALLAIKRGWRSLENEGTLVRLAMNAKDAKVQKEVTEVVRNLRN